MIMRGAPAPQKQIKGEMVMRKMTQEEFIKYAKGLSEKRFTSEMAAEEAWDKTNRILKRYGFEIHRFFDSKWKSTSCFLRKKVGEYGFIEIQTGYRYEYGRKSNTKTGICFGIFRVTDNSKPDLNPRTGRPWAIGDIKHVAPGYSLILTERGWSSGD